jgi:formylglycine-generating enzyme required for sulfatase activity
MHVFISYQSAHLDTARSIGKNLEDAGIDVWIAQQRIREGEWRIHIEQAIDSASAFLLVVGHGTTDSIEVENEFRRAQQQGKPIVPIRIDDSLPPLYAAALHFLDWRPGTAVDAILEVLRAPTNKRRQEEVWYLERARNACLSMLENYVPPHLQADSDGLDLEMTDLVIRAMAQQGNFTAMGEDHGSSSLAKLLEDIRLMRRPRLTLIGDPGAGKTTTLFRIFSELVEAAQSHWQSRIPILVSLRQYSGDRPLIDYIAQRGRELQGFAPRLSALLDQGRLTLLLDGLNELPGTGDSRRLAEIRSFLERYRDVGVVITCRDVDYNGEVNLGLDVFRIQPLNAIQIQDVIRNASIKKGDELNDLFWEIVGDRDPGVAKSFFDEYTKAGGKESTFLLGREYDDDLTTLAWREGKWELWTELRDSPLSLLHLAGNPYMLSMMISIYSHNQFRLGRSPYELFKLFSTVLINDEKPRRTSSSRFWLDEARQTDLLTALAWEMRLRSTSSIDLESAVAIVGAAEILDLFCDERFLEVSVDSVSFSHQMMQEYFVCLRLDADRRSGLRLTALIPSSRWWEASGWEEAVVLLAGAFTRNPVGFLNWVRDADPELTARCIIENRISIDASYKETLAAAWLPRLTNPAEDLGARASIGRALGKLDGDNRPGVCHIDRDGIPVLEWRPVSGVDESGQRQIDDFMMSRFMVTNAQFAAFVNDDGYLDRWRNCWTDEGWQYKGDRSRPDEYTEVFRLPNHPRIGISWYEAVAFTNWLSEKLRATAELPDDVVVRLATEDEWEWVTSNHGKTRFPWGNEYSDRLCNVTAFRSTTTVGIFPEGSSSDGILDLIGNAWSWCLTKWAQDRNNPDNTIGGTNARVYRGGSWAFDLNYSVWRPHELEATSRHWIVPEDDRPDAIGMFVVIGKRTI